MEEQSRAGFRRLWLSTGSGNLADGILLAGLPVMATTVTTSPSLVAGVQVAFMSAIAVAALPSGVLTDRHDHRNLLVWSNVLRVLGLGAVLAAVVLGDWRLGAIYAAALLAGSTEMVADTTAEVAVPALVPRTGLAAAHSRLVGTQLVMNDGVGAPIGGWIAAGSMGAGMAVPAVLYGVAAAIVRPLRLPAVDRPPRRPARTEVVEGFAALRRDPLLLRMGTASMLMNVANTAFFAVAVLLVIGPMALPRSAYGAVLLAVAVGGVVGSGLADRIVDTIGVRRVLQVSPLVLGGAYGLIGLAADTVVTVVSLAVLGASGIVWNISSRVIRQQRVPAPLLGRVSASMKMLALAAAPVGGVLGGVVADLAGVRWVGALALSFGVAAAVVLWRVDPDMRPREDQPSEPARPTASRRSVPVEPPWHPLPPIR
ncbi:MFS transporter [Euzebya pacifica]|uniref:MFS transporter n=1 Tax=Euzebya pacifica TaxID=1608957 RepID=UPI0030FD1CA0